MLVHCLSFMVGLMPRPLLILSVSEDHGVHSPRFARDTSSTIEMSRTLPDGDRPTRRVTLDEVLAHALRHAPRARRAHARTKLGDAAIEAAQPWFPGNPRVQLGIGSRMNALGVAPEAQLQVTQPLEIARERSLRKTSARAQLRALEVEVQSVQWQTTVEVRALFRHALVAKRRAIMAKEFETFASGIMETTETLVEVGEESPLRLQLARGRLADAEQAAIAAAFAYRSSTRGLARAAGWSPDAELEPTGQLPQAASGVRPISAQAVLRDHPTIRAARSRVDATQTAEAAAIRDAWPEPSLGAYVAYEREPGTPRGAAVALAMIGLPLPFWQRNQAERARTTADRGIAETELAVLEAALIRDLEQGRDAVRTAAERLQTYTEEVMPRFSENLALVRRAFELGEIDVLEVFVAEERFMDLHRRALDVYDDYIEAVRAFELATAHSVTLHVQP